jgi:ABC-type thiamin/hydroxymethylpyrimidine transport system permease subunit
MRIEIIYGGLISIIVGLIFLILSIFENVKNLDMEASSYLEGTGIIIMVLGLIATVYGFVFIRYNPS